jgi:hypothetical protein
MAAQVAALDRDCILGPGEQAQRISAVRDAQRFGSGRPGGFRRVVSLQKIAAKRNLPRAQDRWGIAGLAQVFFNTLTERLDAMPGFLFG